MVSRLTIASKPQGAQGASIVMEDGIKSEAQPYGMANGTVISVEHLFRTHRLDSHSSDDPRRKQPVSWTWSSTMRLPIQHAVFI